MIQPRRFLLGLDVLVVAQSLYYYKRLPAAVASHFDAAGQPNGWSTPEAFVLLQISIAALITLVFLGLPVFLRGVPTAFWNLPHKEYWLAPDRRASTIADLENRFCWLGAATIALILCVFQIAIEANFHSDHRLTSDLIWPLLGAYVVGAIVFAGRLIVHYARAEPAAPIPAARPVDQAQRKL
jgi:hypothetical protein